MYNDPFDTQWVRKKSLNFDSDQELDPNPEEVKTPKQTSSLFQINYSQDMYYLNIDPDAYGTNDDGVSDRATNQ